MRKLPYLLGFPGAFLGLVTDPHTLGLTPAYGPPAEALNVSQQFTDLNPADINHLADSFPGRHYSLPGLVRLHQDVRPGDSNAVYIAFNSSEQPNNPGILPGSLQMQPRTENDDRIILKGGVWIRRSASHYVDNLDTRINFKNTRIDGNDTGPRGLTTLSLAQGTSTASTSLPNDVRALTGSYVGEYRCMQRQGLTRLRLDIRAHHRNQIDAVFRFSEHARNKGVPSGSFKMQGTLEGGNRLRLYGGEWISRPPGWITVDLDGNVSDSLGRISGQVTTPGCSSFQVFRGSPFPLIPRLQNRFQALIPRSTRSLNNRSSKNEWGEVAIQDLILELERQGYTISEKDLLEGYEYLIKSGIKIGHILAVANGDPSLGSFFDAAGNVIDAYKVATLILDFASIYRSLDGGDKEAAVIGFLEIGLSRNILANTYVKLTGQDVSKDISTIFNINRGLDLLHRQADGHFQNMPNINELITRLDPGAPYSVFERDLQDAGLWHEWQIYLTSDAARNFKPVYPGYSFPRLR